MLLRIALLVLALLCGASAASAQARAAGRGGACRTTESTETITAVGDAGEIRLASGRTAKLSGLRLPEDGALRAAAASVLRGFAGRRLAAAARPEDRWGRLPLRLVVADGSRLDLAHALLEQGLAQVDPGEAEAFCQPELLALEATARERGVGVWADDGYKPVPAHDRERLRSRIGRFVLVEGRIRSVGERRQRTYLNFGPDGTRDVTITIPKRTWTIMVENGLSADALRQRRIRARGILETGRGPAIEVTVPEMIEVLDQERGRR